MIPATWKLYAWGAALAVALTAGWAFVAHEREVGARDAEIRSLTTEVASLRGRRDSVVTRYVHDARAVADWRRRYAALRDSARAHDVLRDSMAHQDTTVRDTALVRGTVWARQALDAADTTVRACTVALSRCDSVRAMNDSLVAKLDRATRLLAGQRPGFWSRFGVWAGLGAAVPRRGSPEAGVAVGVGIRVWP